MRIKLYLDEDVPFAFAQALLNRGVDVITTQEVRNDSKSNKEQLDYATKEQRVIFTHNKKDFILLHHYCPLKIETVVSQALSPWKYCSVCKKASQ